MCCSMGHFCLFEISNARLLIAIFGVWERNGKGRPRGGVSSLIVLRIQHIRLTWTGTKQSNGFDVSLRVRKREMHHTERASGNTQETLSLVVVGKPKSRAAQPTRNRPSCLSWREHRQHGSGWWNGGTYDEYPACEIVASRRSLCLVLVLSTCSTPANAPTHRF